MVAPARRPVRLRQTSGVVIPALSWAVLGYFLLDALVRGDVAFATRALPLLLGLALAVFAVLWRPAVDVFSDRVVVRNPTRTLDAPFAAVTDIRTGPLLRVVVRDRDSRTGTRTVAAWNAPGSRRRHPHPVTTPTGSDLVTLRWQTWVRQHRAAEGTGTVLITRTAPLALLAASALLVVIGALALAV